MLRPLSIAASALILCALAACASKDSPAAGSADSPITNTADGGTSTQSSSSSGGEGTSSSGAPVTDPGTTTVTTDDGGTTTVNNGDKLKITNEDVVITGSSGNDTRHYILAQPKTLEAGRKYPLIVALHGDGGNAQEFVSESGLIPVVGADAIVVFTDQVLDLFTTYGNNHDQRLIRAAILDAESKTNAVDTTKIWGFGYSKGAFMLNEMACRKPGLFTAMAPHAGGAPQEQNSDGSVNCPNAQAIPMFITEGGNDDPEGGKFEADFWAGLAGCSGKTAPTTPSICVKYTDGCGSATPVNFCTIPNHGHAPLYANAASDSWTWFNSLGK